MGAVWLGTDEVLGRPVALKRLAPIHDPAHARAEREARLAARVNHPYVVMVYDLVAEGADQWLVMEYVEGTTLAALIAARGALSPDELAPILRQVAAALEASHAAGVVHRDVKPSNILVDLTGTAKLTDFGIARSADQDATLTQTGFLTGSPSYLAPEVIGGQPASAASDVWSLGATAFHALAGRPPYEVGENVVGALYRIVHEQPPRTDRAGWLAPLVAGLMTPDPARRWSLAQAQAFLAGPPVRSAGETRVLPAIAPAAPLAPIAPDPSRRSRHWWAAAGAVLATGVVALGLGLAAGTHGDDTAGRTGSGATGSTAPSPTPAVAGDGASPTGGPTDTPTGGPADGPTEESIRGFVATYLRAASEDPAQGFAMLTPDYQRRSGGLAGYERFWGNVRKVHDISDVLPSLDPLGVSYRYTYTMRGAGKRTENVQLRLVYDQGRFLIAAS